MKVKIDTKKLNTETRVKRAIEAGDALEIITSSPRFDEKILSMPAKWRKGESSKFKNFSNEALLAHLKSGAEEWNGIADKEIDLEVDDYKKMWSKVVGYMIPGKRTVFVNTKFFDTMSMKRVVSNFLHEWGHTMGLRHSGENFKSSIAYYLNQVVETLYDELVEGHSIGSVWKKVCTRKWYRFFRKKCYLVRVR